MKRILTTIIFALCLIGLIGCENNEQPNTEAEVVSYDLPAGWEHNSITHPWKSATREEDDPVFQYTPFSKIEFTNPFKGTPEDAQKTICPEENFNEGKCEYVSDENYRVGELKIDEYKVFYRSSKGILGGEELWQNTVAFAKNGQVYKIIFTGYQIEEYQEELEMIVRTIE